jgi:hypothetical protein
VEQCKKCNYYIIVNINTSYGVDVTQVNINNPLVQDVVKDSLAVQAAHDATGATFQLASCGWVVGPLGDRSYWDTILPPSWAISSIDKQVGDAPVDPAYINITHRPAANKCVVAVKWKEWKRVAVHHNLLQFLYMLFLCL